MSLSPRAIALQGVGSAALVMALQGMVGVGVAAGGDDQSTRPRRRKYIVRDGNQLLVFETAAAAADAEQRIGQARAQALRAIAKAASGSRQRRSTVRQAEAVRQAVAQLPVPPLDQVSLPQLQAGAAGFAHLQAALAAAQAVDDAEAAYSVWQSVQRAIQQDEDDIAALMEFL